MTVFDGGDVPYEASNLAQIGRAVAAILSPDHFEKTSNQYVYINSFTLTQNSVIKALEKATGSKFKVTHMSSEEVWKQGQGKNEDSRVRRDEWCSIQGGRRGDDHGGDL